MNHACSFLDLPTEIHTEIILSDPCLWLPALRLCKALHSIYCDPGFWRLLCLRHLGVADGTREYFRRYYQKSGYLYGFFYEGRALLHPKRCQHVACHYELYDDKPVVLAIDLDNKLFVVHGAKYADADGFLERDFPAIPLPGPVRKAVVSFTGLLMRWVGLIMMNGDVMLGDIGNQPVLVPEEYRNATDIAVNGSGIAFLMPSGQVKVVIGGGRVQPLKPLYETSSNSVVSVFAGSRACWCLVRENGDCEFLFYYERSMDGARLLTCVCETLRGKKIVSVAFTYAHCALVTGDGGVFIASLSRPNEDPWTISVIVPKASYSPHLKAVSVSACSEKFHVIDDKGHMWRSVHKYGHRYLEQEHSSLCCRSSAGGTSEFFLLDTPSYTETKENS